MDSEKKKEREEMKQQKKYIKERKEIIESERDDSAIDAGEAENISGAEGGFEHSE